MKRKAILIALSLICTLCVFSFAGCFGGEDPHEHTYSDEWTYDETYHWHESTCVHLNETLDKARHDYDEGVETAPTFEHGGYITYTCYDCGYELIIETEDALSHNYSNVWSYDSYNHWHACTDQGYENLKGDLTAHTDTNEIIIRGATDSQAGLAQYTCSECLNTYQKPVYVSTEILTLPTVANQKVYIGQTLSALTLTGGSASVDGVFSWSNPSEKIIWSGNYEVTFTPTDTSVFAPTTCEVYVNAEFLTVNVTVGANGSANYNGIVSVEWGANLTITITPNLGYQVDSLMVDGVGVASATAYTFKNITTNHTITATFRELEVLPFTLTCISGTSGCYTYSGSTLTITEISAATVYAISGEFDGNIVIDVGDTYKFDLELHGFTLNCNYINPITILSGDEVAIQAKAGYQNYIYDNRAKIDETDTTLYSGAIHSMVDLEISGKGTLTVVSQNNNGIHGKDDLQVKNLTLSVSCIDNALKGNDGVEILNANTTLIARQGDCIKSVNSHINSTTLKQKGTISISGGTHNLYAACDGIDSSYDVVIDDATTVLNIYTDKYSEYSEEVTVVSENTYYLSATTTNYKYSVKYYNSNTGDTLWVDASTSYETVTSSSNRPGGSSSSTYYYTFAKKSGYTSLAVYLYSSTQTQGQDTNYVACSEYKTISDSYDTVKVTYSSSNVSLSWTNYTTSSSSGGMGGMQEGNTDKGTYSTKGIKASNQITINNGTITIEAYDDAIHANNDVILENGVTPLGNITIAGGVITVSSNDDGLHADGVMTVSGGTIKVLTAYEGIEGFNIVVSGGDLSVTSKDDGFNATATSGAGITLSGGKVYIYAGGDGIDSNSTTSKGAIIFSGANVVVICTSNGNAAIDSDGGYSHTAGKVIAITSTGGMTSECTNGNSTGMTVKSSISLSNGGYMSVSVLGSTTLTLKVPVSLSAHVVYLGSSSATISTTSSSSASFDANGVCWH